MTSKHLWQGEWINDAELDLRLKHLEDWAATGTRLPTLTVLDAADRLSQSLQDRRADFTKLAGVLGPGGEAILSEMGEFLSRRHLEKKLQVELGSLNPDVPTRASYVDSLFEAWAPIGVLTHVTPANGIAVAPLSVLEGLLAGNRNFLKSSAHDGDFPQLFLERLIAHDMSRTLGQFLIAARISSADESRISRVLAASDGIAVWGGEEAVASIKKMAPPSARVIEWGHKISFAYLTLEAAKNAGQLLSLARECCQFEQQACSSPQCVFLDTDDPIELNWFAAEMAKALEQVSQQYKRPKELDPSPAERAEITLVTELAQEERIFGKTNVWEGKDHSWRVLLDERSSLAASPLFRTVWVKPLPRKKIVAAIRPLRAYLQTVGLACGIHEFADLADQFVAAGAVRVRRLGEMTGSYSTEAHDGVYPLQRYSRRICLQAGPEASGISSFAELRAQPAKTWERLPPILTKADFQRQSQELSSNADSAQLFFKSGGSSGDPKLSLFTYRDYHEQMRVGAEGLYAAGLDPVRDRCINLFFSGALYGGFLSMFSILEYLQAPQLPMAAHMDFPAVADTIVRNRVTTALGMPSYLIQLFEACGETLREYGKIKKVYFGGEHFHDSQRRYLKERFGVEIIRSVGYGSVDTGPLGYQCIHCEPGEHHLHQTLQSLEIIDLNNDVPVKSADVGRLIFTSLQRQGQNLDRYDLGDVGRWVEAACPCGRASPRFRLLGRSGDVFRIGTMFLNFEKFVTILCDQLGFAGQVQIELLAEGLREKARLILSSPTPFDTSVLCKGILDRYDDLREVVVDEELLDFEVVAETIERMTRLPGSGKLARILDRRLAK